MNKIHAIKNTGKVYSEVALVTIYMQETSEREDFFIKKK